MPFLVKLIVAAVVIGVSSALASPASEQWSVDKTKSPIDDSTGIVAVLASKAETSEIYLRCREGRIDVSIYILRPYTSFNSSGVNVIYRIGDNKAVRAKWIASTDNRAVFASNGRSFLSALPNSGRLVIRIEDFRRSQTDHIFELRDVDSLRSKIVSLCPTEAKGKSTR